MDLPGPCHAECMNHTARDAKRASRAIEHLPARSMVVSVDAATAHEFARRAMERHHYMRAGTVTGGVASYQWGTLFLEFLSNLAGAGLILRLMGRHDSYARFAVWTEAEGENIRLTASMVTGLFHSDDFRVATLELIEQFDEAGMLVSSSDAFSGIDLPKNSPGRPAAHRWHR